MKINVDLEEIKDSWAVDKFKFFAGEKEVINASDFTNILNELFEDEYNLGYEDGEDDKGQEMFNELNDFKKHLEDGYSENVRLIEKMKKLTERNKNQQ